MAAAVGGVRVAVALLMCVLGGQALDLQRATATSGSEYQLINYQTIGIFSLFIISPGAGFWHLA